VVDSRSAFGVASIAMAVVCVVALVGRYVWALGGPTFTTGNYLGYLTIQSNIAFAMTSALAGVAAVRRMPESRVLTTLRAATLTMTVTSGLVYGILVQQSAARGFPLTVPWSDQVLHFALPVLALVHWGLDPGRGRPPWRILAFVDGYTVVWGVLTLIRGARVGWYPYFFLDPNQVSGIPELAMWCAIALAAFAAIGAGIVALGHVRSPVRIGRASPVALNRGRA
jgi:hypothetical protein